MSAYTVLLILTDGVIQDMPKTKDAIVAAADMPMSIVIVGVGNADFSNMEVLDGDDVALTNSRGQAAKRDIVQFVEFQKYGMGQEARLAKDVIAEIPEQILRWEGSKFISALLSITRHYLSIRSYARTRRITPNKPTLAPTFSQYMGTQGTQMPAGAAEVVVSATHTRYLTPSCPG